MSPLRSQSPDLTSEAQLTFDTNYNQLLGNQLLMRHSRYWQLLVIKSRFDYSRLQLTFSEYFFCKKSTVKNFTEAIDLLVELYHSSIFVVLTCYVAQEKLSVIRKFQCFFVGTFASTCVIVQAKFMSSYFPSW